jgi:hypothetical protein
MTANDYDAARRRALELANYDDRILARFNDNIRHERFAQVDVIIALDQSAGIASLAARRLGCSRRTVTNYIARYPAVRIALQSIRDELVDFARAKILELIQARNPRVVIWYASRYGQARGYGRSEQAGPATRQTEAAIPWSELDLSPEHIRAIQAALTTRSAA